MSFLVGLETICAVSRMPLREHGTRTLKAWTVLSFSPPPIILHSFNQQTPKKLVEKPRLQTIQLVTPSRWYHPPFKPQEEESSRSSKRRRSRFSAVVPLERPTRQRLSRGAPTPKNEPLFTKRHLPFFTK